MIPEGLLPQGVPLREVVAQTLGQKQFFFTREDSTIAICLITFDCSRAVQTIPNMAFQTGFQLVVSRQNHYEDEEIELGTIMQMQNGTAHLGKWYTLTLQDDSFLSRFNSINIDFANPHQLMITAQPV